MVRVCKAEEENRIARRLSAFSNSAILKINAPYVSHLLLKQGL